MKNFILILFMLVFAFTNTTEAQNKTIYDVDFDSEQVLRQYRGKALDTVSTNKTTFSYTIYNSGQATNKEKFTQYWLVALDSISGTAADVTIAYQRRMNVFNTWTTDSTQTFAGTTSDTTLIYYDTTVKPDPYRRVLVTYGSGFVVKIDWLSVLFLLE